MWVNFSLTLLSSILRAYKGKKAIPTGGEGRAADPRYKEADITRAISGSFFGTALTTFIYCASQHRVNGGETWYTMEFAQDSSYLKANVTKTKGKNIKSLLKEYTALQVENDKHLAS